MDDGNLPLAFLLLGAGAVLAFVALRPWPQTTKGTSITPEAYTVDILRGQAPKAGPSSRPTAAEIDLTEAGLVAIVSYWLLGQAAKLFSSLYPGGGALGGGGGADNESDTEAGEEAGGDVTGGGVVGDIEGGLGDIAEAAG
jgi:hypothetical protein